MGCVPSRVYAIVQSAAIDDDDNPEFLLQTIEDHKLGVNCIEISEDRSLLVTGGEDCIARLFSTLSTPCECIGVLLGHQVCLQLSFCKILLPHNGNLGKIDIDYLSKLDII